MVCGRRTVSLQPYLLDDSCVSAERRKPRNVTDGKSDVGWLMVVLHEEESHPVRSQVLVFQVCGELAVVPRRGVVPYPSFSRQAVFPYRAAAIPRRGVVPIGDR